MAYIDRHNFFWYIIILNRITQVLMKSAILIILVIVSAVLSLLYLNDIQIAGIFSSPIVLGLAGAGLGALITALLFYRSGIAVKEDLKKYTVIGFYSNTGQIFCAHVHAKGSYHAFSVAALAHPDGEFLSALDGHITEGQGIEFAGESIVDSDTILSQPEVF